MIIAGAKGFAKEVLEVLIDNSPTEDIIFFDDISFDLPELLFNQFPIYKTIDDLERYIKTVSPKFVLGLGNPTNRKLVSEKIQMIGGQLINTISKHTNIGKFGMTLDNGINIMQHVTLTSDIKIGQGVLLNIHSTIGHDCTIEDYVEICPGVNISGNCHIGAMTFIGTNATILPGITIGSNVTIGAGSVVTKDIPDNIVVMGIPAKPFDRS